MADRRMFTTRGSIAPHRYLYGDDGGTRFGEGVTYSSRWQGSTGGRWGGRSRGTGRSSFGQGARSFAWPPSASRETDGVASVATQTQTKRKPDSPSDRESGCECDLTSETSLSSEEVRYLGDPNTTVIELTDSEGESPKYKEETKTVLKELRSPEEPKESK